MVFAGDIALPFKGHIKIADMPDKLKNCYWFANLEGTLINDIGQELLNKRYVFNNFEAIETLTKEFSFAGVGLANNHITDAADIETTITNLSKLHLPYVGAGIDGIGSMQPLRVNDNGTGISILNFGWEVIHCELAGKNDGGVNPYRKQHVIDTLISEKKAFPMNKVICFFHWNYELEIYPQPFDRELAFNVIDLGADAVIGCHSHRVQGAEFYKGKPVIYGLGNWLFAQSVFMNGALRFPSFCDLQLAVEINFLNNEYQAHFFKYDKEKSMIRFLFSEFVDMSKTLDELTPFRGMAPSEYKRWFKKNRFQKKLLPVYNFEDPDLVIAIKNNWIKCRDVFIKILITIGLK